jgi:hypothetical protein
MKQQVAAILQERLRQKRVWGALHDPGDGIFLAVLIEECGEVAKAINEPWPQAPNPEEMKAELAQVAAAALAWMEAIDARNTSS